MSSTETLITALRILAREIQSDDGVANAAIAEAADRLEDLQRENAALRNATTELLLIAKTWATVWGDKLSPENLSRFEKIETQILATLERKEAQP